MKNNLSKKQIASLLTTFLITLLLTIFLQKTVINNPETIQIWLKSFGVFTILAYIVIQLTTIIIAPLGGLAAAIAVLAIFGPFWGVVIIYLVTSPAYIINFLIARKYGRRFVKKIIGENGLKIVDKYSKKLTIDVLILLKLFLGGYADFVAYAAGFSKINLKTFVLITFVCGIPGSVLQYLIFKFSPSFTSAVVLLILIPALLGLLYLPFHRKTKKYLQKNNIVPGEVN